MTRTWLFSMLLLHGCAASIADHHFEAKVAGAPRIALLNGGVSSVATRVREAFVRNSDYDISEFVLEQDFSEYGINAALQALQPRAIVALGRRAADFAHESFPDVPLIYTLMVEDEAHRIEGPHVAGIGLDLEPTAEFMMYKLVLGDLHKVSAFYTPGRADTLAHHMHDALKTLDIELELLPISDEEGMEMPAAQIKDAEAVWLFNDPGLLTQSGFKRVLAVTNQAHKPLLCSSFREFAAAGAMMAFTLNFENIGSQVAVLVAEFVERGTLADGPGLRAPLGGYLVFNSTVATRLGTVLSGDAQPFVSEIITSTAAETSPTPPAAQ